MRSKTSRVCVCYGGKPGFDLPVSFSSSWSILAAISNVSGERPDRML